MLKITISQNCLHGNGNVEGALLIALLVFVSQTIPALIYRDLEGLKCEDASKYSRLNFLMITLLSLPSIQSKNQKMINFMYDCNDGTCKQLSL